jgi:hypothetical protein
VADDEHADAKFDAEMETFPNDDRDDDSHDQHPD